MTAENVFDAQSIHHCIAYILCTVGPASGRGTSIETAYYGTLIGIKVPLCKAVRPCHSVRRKIRLTESGTDLITILKYFLSFKTVVTSQTS